MGVWAEHWRCLLYSFAAWMCWSTGIVETRIFWFTCSKGQKSGCRMLSRRHTRSLRLVVDISTRARRRRNALTVRLYHCDWAFGGFSGLSKRGGLQALTLSRGTAWIAVSLDN